MLDYLLINNKYMVKLGIAIKKGELWFSVLEGTTQADASVKLVDKRNFQTEQDVTELMMSFHSLFSELITAHRPSSIAIKMSLNVNINQVPYLHCSLGVLAYICRVHNIRLTLRSSVWISAGKKKKLIECEQKFIDNKLKNEKLHSTLIALYEFNA